MSAGTSEFFCLICLLVCSCTAQKIIPAKHGQDVILPCKAPNINNKNDITAAEWIRPGLDPEFVLLYRDGSFDPINQHPSYTYRVDLQDKEMKDGNFCLILKNVKMEDTGKYVCRVSQKGKTEPFSIIYLKVYLSAQENITAERGQDVILPCKVPNINNITAAEWRRPGLDPDYYVLLYRDGHLAPDSQHPFYKNRVDLQDKEMKDGDFYLILKKVTMEDRGTYMCLVDQSGKTELISIINLEVYDYSRTTLGIVGFVVGVLVCLLSAAAVYLFQNRKEKKTLERTNQQCKDENLKSMKTEKKLKTVVQNVNKELKKMNCCTNSNPTGSFKENPQEERMKTGRKLKAVVQNVNKELICCTNSDPTESDEENQQQKRMKTGRKLKAVVQNVNKELKKMNCCTNSNPTGSFKENPQEEDEKLQEEDQKLMETGRNLQTEPQNMNQELKLEGPITVVDVHERGDVICPQNTSSEEIELEGWKLQLQKNYREPVIYTFKESDRIQAEDSFTVRCTIRFIPHPDDFHLWPEMKRRPEDKVQFNLINNKGEIFRLLEYE
ncbi:uncharacterized protein LOC127532602 isoform X2 [Acanthochromis polyacanthus]|uniref:uncharacterized protein LOC127532602 isoform X2 n=1 Tax=Acanthochromis polyacanthus TaxID=80966 RepID=UPI002234C789|nr:uncharacterized protein LOC127532602 isoform X2 [Acanthochromis polyacanthus]